MYAHILTTNKWRLAEAWVVKILIGFFKYSFVLNPIYYFRPIIYLLIKPHIVKFKN